MFECSVEPTGEIIQHQKRGGAACNLGSTPDDGRICDLEQVTELR